ncbi:AbrB/MazE/SpoVT family DNA-binding domain-containing protein [Enterovirga sp. CN4-39]|uniref:AbrB/MazE/SpoVT family DNA-binding domain-containing protein n=1 Tax=Enterovirga sp. CN4-39 TaxID=3400910 RepID=UPI003C04A114
MKTFEATVTSKGQVTIPAKLRSALGLKSGDKLVFRRSEEGRVEVEALSASLGDLIGIVSQAPTTVDGDQIARWIEQSRTARWRSGRP